MTRPVIAGAVRTPVATSFKGSLVNVAGETLAEIIIGESVKRSGLDPLQIDDVILAESNYGGGDLARFGALAAGLPSVPGQAVNRHCAGSLTAVGNAAAQIRAGAERLMVAGGVQSMSTGPVMRWRIPGNTANAVEFKERWMPPTHPETPDAPALDMSITVGWNTARKLGISRERMDAWALRSHQRAVAAIDAGHFADEIVGVDITRPDGQAARFTTDEHPRRNSSAEKLAALAPLHPEIDGFSITAGNSSGVNDAAAALVLADPGMEGLEVLGTVMSWAACAAEPRDTGMAAVQVIGKILDRTGVGVKDVALWEINEAFACVPIAACGELGIDDDVVNPYGSGCSLGHPVAATGARMLTSLVHALRRRGGGIGVAAMCAGGGQAGAVMIEV